jgi:hypothetical protein
MADLAREHVFIAARAGAQPIPVIFWPLGQVRARVPAPWRHYQKFAPTSQIVCHHRKGEPPVYLGQPAMARIAHACRVVRPSIAARRSLVCCPTCAVTLNSPGSAVKSCVAKPSWPTHKTFFGRWACGSIRCRAAKGSAWPEASVATAPTIGSLRFLLKVVASHTGSSTPSQTNQRNRRSNSMRAANYRFGRID